MKPKSKEDELALASLVLDPENSRHGYLPSQIEVIDWMLEGGKGMGTKIYNLAKDIVKWGLIPSEKVSVVPHPELPEKYIVMEGNRRVTALMMLFDPASAPTQSWQAKFSKLASTEGFTPIIDIPTVIYYDEELLHHYLEVKHMGELGGIGIVSWDAYQKSIHESRFNDRRTKYFKAKTLLDHIIANPGTYGSLATSIGQKFSITTLDRMLNDRDFREFLGMGMSTVGDLLFTIDPKEASKPIKKLVGDLASKKVKVDEVKNSTLREVYISRFNPSELPKTRKQLVEPEPVAGTVIVKKKPLAAKSKKKVKRFGNPKDRSTVVMRGEHLSINPTEETRLFNIFDELRTLSLKDKRNAVAILLRSFLEMSALAYLENRGVKCPSPNGWGDISLARKIKLVNQHLKDSGFQTNNEFKVINTALGSAKKITHPNNWNDLTHNRHQIVHPSDLIDIWDTYHNYLKKIFEHLQ